MTTLTLSGYKQLPHEPLLRDASFLTVKAANATPIHLLGYLLVPQFHIFGTCIEDVGILLVNDTPGRREKFPLLLGTNVLDQLNRADGVASDSVTADITPNTEFVPEPTRVRRGRIRLRTPFLVPARSAIPIPISISNMDAEDILVDPSPTFYTRTLVSNPVICNKHDPYFIAVNPSSEDVHIPPHTVCATVRNLQTANISSPPISVSSDEILVGEEETPLDPKYDLSTVKLGLVVTPEQDLAFRNLLHEYTDVFAKHPNDLGSCSTIRHQIRTDDDTPVRVPPRRIHPALFGQVKDEVSRLLKAGIIRPSTSPYCAPIVVVRKPNGDLRCCVDYRALNKKITHHAIPLPRIDETLEMASNKSVFSSFDLVAGYHQIELEPSSIPKTAFAPGTGGHYEWLKMPFGLKNAGATFTRLGQELFDEALHRFLLVYLDDILVLSSSVDEHIEHLRYLFQRLRFANLKAKLPKCVFLTNEIKYLGHLISPSGIQPNPERLAAVRDLKPPSSYKELHAFVGLASFYRRHIRSFAKIANPLTSALQHAPSTLRARKKRGIEVETQRPFESVWDQSCLTAFETLREALVSSEVLVFPDFTKPFLLETDASGHGFGAVLSQVVDGQSRVVAFASRTLRPHERNDALYSSKRIEFLALKWAILEKFRPYLEWSHFHVLTDNSPLQFFKSTEKLSPAETRWAAQLGRFSFDIRYKPRAYLVVPDALSRLPKIDDESLPEPDDVERIPLELAQKFRNRFSQTKIDAESDSLSVTPTLPCIDPQQIRRIQAEDPALSPIFAKLNSNVNQDPHWIIKDGILYRHKRDSDLLVVPPTLRKDILHWLHDRSGHCGINKIVALLRSRFWWPRSSQDAAALVKGCSRCRESKPPPRKLLVQEQRFKPTRPLELVCLDYTVLEPALGIENVLVITDALTKYTVAVPTRDQKATTVAEALLKHWIYPYGIPERIHSDQGRNFTSSIVESLCQQFGIAKSKTAAYHPQGNPFAERFNRTLHDRLRVLETSEKRQWPKFLMEVCWLYNITPHESTGVSPYFALFGRNPKHPVDFLFPRPTSPSDSDWITSLRHRLQVTWDAIAARIRSKEQPQIVPDPPELPPGRIVLCRARYRVRSKIQDHFSQVPYIVIRRVAPSTYQIRRADGGPTLTHRQSDLLDTGQNCSTLPEEEPDENADISQIQPPSIQTPLLQPAVPSTTPVPLPRRTTRQNAGQHPNPFHLPR